MAAKNSSCKVTQKRKDPDFPSPFNFCHYKGVRKTAFLNRKEQMKQVFSQRTQRVGLIFKDQQDTYNVF